MVGMALLVVATLLGAALQSLAGFGFALVLAPAALSVLEPDEAVTTLLVLALALNALVLVGMSLSSRSSADGEAFVRDAAGR